MTISFRDRKYGQPMDSMFFLEEAEDQRYWQVGDEVSILFEINPSLIEPLREAVSDLCEPQRGLYPHPQEKTVHVHCKVAKRHHGLSWRTVGKLSSLGIDIVLEASNGYHEDILRLCLFGEVPKWVQEFKPA